MGFQNRRPDVKPPSIAGCQGKAESSVEVTHLALARCQNAGTAFWEFYISFKSDDFIGLFFLLIFKG